MLNTINTASTNALYSASTEAGAADKPLAAKLLVDIKDILPILPILNSAGRDGKALAEVMRGPQLRPPSVEVRKPVTDALKSYLSEKAQDPAFVQDLHAVHQKVESGVSKLVDDRVKEQAEQGKPFDISGMAPNGVALLVAAIVMLSAVRTADNTLSSKLSLIGFDATKATAASMVREGVANLSGSVVQGFSQMAITGVGAKKSLSGINAERGALKNNAPKLANAGNESRNIQTTLGRQNSVKLGTDADGLKHMGLKQQQPGAAKLGAGEPGMQSNAAGSVADGMTGDKIGLKSSNQNLSKQHETALGSVSEDLSVKSPIEQQTMDGTKLKAQAKQTTGKAIMDISSVASNIPGASARVVATNEQSFQQLSQAGARTMNAASEELSEKGRKGDSLIERMMQALDNFSQSTFSAMGHSSSKI